MQIIRRVIYPQGSNEHTVVDTSYPTHYLEPGEVRTGFDKGTLDKAIFQLSNGHTIEYERKPEE